MDASIWKGGADFIERGRCKKPPPWRGLEPARALDDSEHGLSLGDEAIRQRLVEARIHKADWEQLDTSIQNRLKDAVRALTVLETAVTAAAVRGPEARRTRARALLRELNTWFKTQEARRSSFAWPHPRAEPSSHLKEKYDDLVELLRAVKKEAVGTRRSFKDERWKAAKVAQVNRLVMHTGLGPARPPCKASHIDELRTHRPTVVAARILAAGFPEASGDQLRRRKSR